MQGAAGQWEGNSRVEMAAEAELGERAPAHTLLGRSPPEPRKCSSPSPSSGRGADLPQSWEPALGVALGGGLCDCATQRT